jgi:hypothetical protein
VSGVRVSRRAALTWLVPGAVALIVAAAAWDTVRHNSSSASARQAEGDIRLRGDALPEEGGLPGTLVFASQTNCRTRILTLETLTVGPAGPAARCGLWVPPRGDLAAISLAAALGFQGSRVSLLRLNEQPELVQELGVVRGDPSWSKDGGHLAWCTTERDTVVLAVETRARRRVEGCRPKIVPDGSVLTRPALDFTATLLRDGDVALDEEQLTRAFPADSDGPLDLVGYDISADGLLAVVTVRFESGRRPRRLLQLWRGEQLQQAILLPELTLPAGTGRLGERVEFDPTGREIAVAYRGAGKQMVLVDLESAEVVIEPTTQHGFAWSPDGDWLAVSTGVEIRILGPERAEPAYVLPVGAAALAWR